MEDALGFGVFAYVIVTWVFSLLITDKMPDQGFWVLLRVCLVLLAPVWITLLIVIGAAMAAKKALMRWKKRLAGN